MSSLTTLSNIPSTATTFLRTNSSYGKTAVTQEHTHTARHRPLLVPGDLSNTLHIGTTHLCGVRTEQVAQGATRRYSYGHPTDLHDPQCTLLRYGRYGQRYAVYDTIYNSPALPPSFNTFCEVNGFIAIFCELIQTLYLISLCLHIVYSLRSNLKCTIRSIA